MPRKAKGPAADLQPGEVEVRTRQVERLTTQEREPFDGWLSKQAARPDLAKILVFKKIPNSGKWAQLRKHVLEPPFDVDPGVIFEEYGDGDYQFTPVKAGTGAFSGARSETILGYGAGTAKPGAPGAKGSSSSFGDVTESLKEQVEYELAMMRLDDLRDRKERRAHRGEAAGTSPAEERLIDEAAQDKALERLIKLQALTGSSNALLEKLLERVLVTSGGGDSTSGAVALLELVLDLKDRLGGGSGPARAHSGWADFFRSLPEMLRAGKEAGLLGPAVSLPAAPGAPRPVAPVAPPAHATVTVEPAAPGAPGQDPRTQAALGAVLVLLRQGVERNSEDLELYASLVDEHLPGFLDEWTALDQEQGLNALAVYDPFFSTEPAITWLKRWWQFLKEDFLVEEPPPAPADS